MSACSESEEEFLRTGTSFTVKIAKVDPETGESIATGKSDQEAVITLFKKRVESISDQEFFFQSEGEDRIKVLLSNLSVPEASKYQYLFKSRGRLEFRMVKPGSSDVPLGSGTEPGWTILPYRDDPLKAGKGLLVRTRPAVTGADIASAYGLEDPREGNIISLKFNEKGTETWANVTRSSLGERFAIVLDGEIYLAPVIREPILNGSSQISGDFTLDEVVQFSQLVATPSEHSLSIEDIRGPEGEKKE